MYKNFYFPSLHCYSAMDVLHMQMQHFNKYQKNQDLSLPSGSDILPIYWSCRASAIYDLPINLRYIHKRVPALMCTQHPLQHQCQYLRSVLLPISAPWCTTTIPSVKHPPLPVYRIARQGEVVRGWVPLGRETLVAHKQSVCQSRQGGRLRVQSKRSCLRIIETQAL